MNPPKNLLIVRTDRIGDVILSLPLAEIVKRNYPDCRVSFLVREYTSSLVQRNPFIDQVLQLQESKNKMPIGDNVKMIKAQKFDTCIVVYPTFELSLILYLSGIKNRIGTGYRWYSFLFNKRVYEHRKYAERHELEYNVGLLKEIGVNEKVSPGNVNFNLKVSDDERESVKKLLRDNGIYQGKNIVIVHPGSGGSSIDLPKEKMIELTKLLSSLEDLTIFITGTESELKLCSDFVVNNNIKNFAGQLTLSELKTLISFSNLLISNSTGPIHIAAALDKHVIGFYPKILSCSVERWGPYTKKRSVFSPAIDCVDCSRRQCEKLECMNSIDIGKVFDESRRVLKI